MFEATYAQLFVPRGFAMVYMSLVTPWRSSYVHE